MLYRFDSKKREFAYGIELMGIQSKLKSQVFN